MIVHSDRAKSLLERPRAHQESPNSQMRHYPGAAPDVWVGLEGHNGIVKNLSFSGQLDTIERLILESAAQLIAGKNILSLDSLTVRECEAFLRDRNSQPAFEFGPELETKFKRLFQWIRTLLFETESKKYQFSSQNGPFRNLKLVDKVRELKAFFGSEEVSGLYQERARPELVDVEDLTVFVQAPYLSEEDRAIFEELHLLGVSTFQEENLNFIPEP